MALADQPECYLWNPDFRPYKTVTWTGACSEGLAQGTGTLKWVWDSGKKTQEYTGRLQDGKELGQWVSRYADDGHVEEGPYVEGKRHGQWVSRYESGRGWEQFYVDGEKVGSTAEDEVMEGIIVEGKQHGDWVLRAGDVERKVNYVNGKRVYN